MDTEKNREKRSPPTRTTSEGLSEIRRKDRKRWFQSGNERDAELRVSYMNISSLQNLHSPGICKTRGAKKLFLSNQEIETSEAHDSEISSYRLRKKSTSSKKTDFNVLEGNILETTNTQPNSTPIRTSKVRQVVVSKTDITPLQNEKSSVILKTPKCKKEFLSDLKIDTSKPHIFKTSSHKLRGTPANKQNTNALEENIFETAITLPKSTTKRGRKLKKEVAPTTDMTSPQYVESPPINKVLKCEKEFLTNQQIGAFETSSNSLRRSVRIKQSIDHNTSKANNLEVADKPPKLMLNSATNLLRQAESEMEATPTWKLEFSQIRKTPSRKTKYLSKQDFENYEANTFETQSNKRSRTPVCRNKSNNNNTSEWNIQEAADEETQLLKPKSAKVRKTPKRLTRQNAIFTSSFDDNLMDTSEPKLEELDCKLMATENLPDSKNIEQPMKSILSKFTAGTNKMQKKCGVSFESPELYGCLTPKTELRGVSLWNGNFDSAEDPKDFFPASVKSRRSTTELETTVNDIEVLKAVSPDNAVRNKHNLDEVKSVVLTDIKKELQMQDSLLQNAVLPQKSETPREKRLTGNLETTLNNIELLKSVSTENTVRRTFELDEGNLKTTVDNTEVSKLAPTDNAVRRTFEIEFAKEESVLLAAKKVAKKDALTKKDKSKVADRRPLTKIKLPAFNAVATSTPYPATNKTDREGTKPGYTRFGFKINRTNNTEIAKAAISKIKPAESLNNTRDAKRVVIKGVRTNRRFELLMKMRRT